MPLEPLDFKTFSELQQWNLQRWKLNHNQSSFRVLVIDSDPIIVQLISTLLENEGYGVEAVASGELGWHRILQYHPHIIISALTLPDMSGVVLCQRVKANPTYPELKTTHFILLTDQLDTNKRSIALKAGADELLTKPIELPELYARVRNGVRLSLLTQSLSHSELRLATYRNLLTCLNFTDDITGVLNQEAMSGSVPVLLEQLQISSRVLSILQISIDGFQQIFDNYGDEVVNELLKAIAGRLQSNSNPTSLIYRYKHTEFICITPDLDLSFSLKLGNHILGAIFEHPVSIGNGLLLDITLSIGGAITNATNSANLPTLLQQSQQALHQAQTANGNCIYMFKDI